MKTKTPIAVLLIFVVAVGLIVFWQKRASLRRSEPALEAGHSNANLTGVAKPTTNLVMPSVGGSPVPRGAENLNASARSAEQRFKEDWEKPIAFYGKVVDESNNPVSAASITFAWNDLSAEGTSKANATSDERGLFVLEEATGRMLTVDISKPGYYLERKGVQFDFEYARNYEPHYHSPDPRNPVVFRLRKRGDGVDLITSQHGVFSELEFSGTRDGSTVRVDFFNQKVGGEGQMEFSAVKPAHGETANAWAFHLVIPNGGFVEENDEFPFYPPESGYQSTVEFSFRVGETNWTDRVRKNYYIVFGKPPMYGRISILTGAYMGVALGYAINPDGTRNLEPKQAAQPSPALLFQDAVRVNPDGTTNSPPQ